MSSPDFAQQWVGSQDADPDSTSPASAQHSARIEEGDSASQQEALEALVDRVNAARSVI